MAVKRNMILLVSACLLGIECRYDGLSARSEELCALIDETVFIPVCPEQLGGLSTPRTPAAIASGDGSDVLDGRAHVLTTDGDNVTDEFLRGAGEVARIAAMMNINAAIMKENSPSCGVASIKRNEALVNGMGVTSALLTRQGIYVISSDNIIKEYVRYYRHRK
jgi:uncharacterized protein YbbK (DUF523 family)